MSVIEELNNQIIEGFSLIPGIEFSGQMPKKLEGLKTPALFLDLGEFEPGEDPGTEETALVTHWEARLMVSDIQEDPVTWGLVTEILLWLDRKVWPTRNIGKAKIKQAAQDHFSPEYQGHHIWLIEWTQKIRVGESIWEGVGIYPTTFCVRYPDGEIEEIDIPERPDD